MGVLSQGQNRGRWGRLGCWREGGTGCRMRVLIPVTPDNDPNPITHPHPKANWGTMVLAKLLLDVGVSGGGGLTGE